MTEPSPLWVIGYGSLIYKPPPHTIYKVRGHLTGYIRRFWQSSSDHRGTPEAPGRVVTLIPAADLALNSLLTDAYHDPENLKVAAVAYYIPAERAAEVEAYLNVREQDGYSVHRVPFHVATLTTDEATPNELEELLGNLPVHPESGHRYLESTIYIGTIHNESFIGPEPVTQTAQVIRTSIGPLGPNIDYLVNLHTSVLELMQGEHDPYLAALVSEVTVPS